MDTTMPTIDTTTPTAQPVTIALPKLGAPFCWPGSEDSSSISLILLGRRSKGQNEGH